MDIKVHGVYNSFADMGRALGYKVKPKTEKPKKCGVCGGRMTKVAGNVWVCPFHKLEDKKILKDGKEVDVQVFSECLNRLITDPYGG